MKKRVDDEKSAILFPVKEFLKHLEKRDLLSQIFV